MDGKIKAKGKCIDGSFEGKWEFYKKAGFLWGIGNFKDNQKHGEWVRYRADGSIEKQDMYQEGKLVS